MKPRAAGGLGAGAGDSLSFRALAEMIPQLVWSTRPNGAIAYANGRFLDYFGIRSDALSTWWLAEHLHPDDVAHATARWRTSLATGEPYEVEYRLRDARGTHHWFLARGTPVHGPDGAIVGWFGTSTPIDRQQERIDRQRRIVEAFQQAFVPQQLPAIDGLVIDAAYFPADEESRVGGDWYDALEFDDGEVILTVGDVTGHGLPAALSMAKVRQAILGAALEARDPADVLARADRVFSLLGGDVIASAVVAFVDRRSRTLRYALAGHPPPIVARLHEARFLPFGGTPLGTGLPGQLHTAEVVLAPDELLVLYTDGLIEAHRTVFEDEARLLAAARACAGGALDAAGIRDAVIGGTPTPDDVAILTLRVP
jgi:PAS domain S-box-containing protein